MNKSTLTAIGSGFWAIADIPDRGFNGSRPYYIGWFHDLNEQTVEERLGAALAFLACTIFIIIASSANIVIYYKRQVKRDFLMLVTILAISNVIFVGDYTAALFITLRTGYWEASDAACSWMMWVLFVMGAFGVGTAALISYERRLCIVSNTLNYRTNTTRLLSIAVILLIVCGVVSYFMAVYPFDIWSVRKISFTNINNGVPVRICGSFEFKLGDYDTGVILFLYYLAACGISSAILGVNYWIIFRHIHAIKKEMAKNIPAGQVRLAGWQSREVFFVKQLLVSFLLFALFHVPAFFSFLFRIFYLSIGPQFERTGLHKISTLFYCSEMALGPIVQSVKQGFFEHCLRLWRKQKAKITHRPVKIGTLDSDRTIYKIIPSLEQSSLSSSTTKKQSV